MSVWPKAHIIVTADNPEQARAANEGGCVGAVQQFFFFGSTGVCWLVEATSHGEVWAQGGRRPDNARGSEVHGVLLFFSFLFFVWFSFIWALRYGCFGLKQS